MRVYLSPHCWSRLGARGLHSGLSERNGRDVPEILGRPSGKVLGHELRTKDSRRRGTVESLRSCHRLQYLRPRFQGPKPKTDTVNELSTREPVPLKVTESKGYTYYFYDYHEWNISTRFLTQFLYSYLYRLYMYQECLSVNDKAQEI